MIKDLLFMQFQIPQFIEYEAKIIGPLTFKQFVYVGVAGIALLVIYFQLPSFLFYPSCIIVGGGAIALAFIKIGGRSLPIIVSNFLKFILFPKMYLWGKKGAQPTVFKKEELGSEELKGKEVGISKKSQIKDLQIKVRAKGELE